MWAQDRNFIPRFIPLQQRKRVSLIGQERKPNRHLRAPSTGGVAADPHKEQTSQNKKKGRECTSDCKEEEEKKESYRELMVAPN